MHRVLLHADVLGWLRAPWLSPAKAHANCLKVLQSLLITGDAPAKFTTGGRNKLWLRSKLFGNRFYLWWAPCGAIKRITQWGVDCGSGDVYVRAVLYHDMTGREDIASDAEKSHLWTPVTQELLDDLRRPGPAGRAGGRASKGVFQTSLATPAASVPDTTAPGHEVVSSLLEPDTTVTLREAVSLLEPPEPQGAPAPQVGLAPLHVVPIEVQDALLSMLDHFKQREMASLVGVRVGTLSKWINGNMSIGPKHWPTILEVGRDPAASRARLDADRVTFERSFQQTLGRMLGQGKTLDQIARSADLDEQEVCGWVLGEKPSPTSMRAVLASAERAEHRKTGRRDTSRRSPKTAHRRSKHSHKGRKR